MKQTNAEIVAVDLGVKDEQGSNNSTGNHVELEIKIEEGNPSYASSCMKRYQDKSEYSINEWRCLHDKNSDLYEHVGLNLLLDATGEVFSSQLFVYSRDEWKELDTTAIPQKDMDYFTIISKNAISKKTEIANMIKGGQIDCKEISAKDDNVKSYEFKGIPFSLHKHHRYTNEWLLTCEKYGIESEYMNTDNFENAMITALYKITCENNLIK